MSEFRIETLNLFNRTNWANPTTNFSSGTFGRLTNTRNGASAPGLGFGEPRNVQPGAEVGFLARTRRRLPRKYWLSARSSMAGVSPRCARNGPVKRAGGEERYHVCQTLHGKAPLGSRESTGPTSNGVNFRDANDIGCSRRFSRSDNRRSDAVPIGGDPLSRPCFIAGHEVHRIC